MKVRESDFNIKFPNGSEIIFTGLDEETKKAAEDLHKKIVLQENPSKDPKTIHVSAKSYLRVTNRRPLLLIYLEEVCDIIMKKFLSIFQKLF